MIETHLHQNAENPTYNKVAGGVAEGIAWGKEVWEVWGEMGQGKGDKEDKGDKGEITNLPLTFDS